MSLVIVVGVTSNLLRECMLRELSLSLEQPIRLGKSAEETQKHIKALEFPKLPAPISHYLTHQIRIPTTQHPIPYTINPTLQTTPLP